MLNCSHIYEDPEDLKERQQRHVGGQNDQESDIGLETPPVETEKKLDDQNLKHLSTWISQERFPLYVKVSSAFDNC